jgi:hypothetical protein
MVVEIQVLEAEGSRPARSVVTVYEATPSDVPEGTQCSYCSSWASNTIVITGAAAVLTNKALLGVTVMYACEEDLADVVVDNLIPAGA